MTLGTLAVIAHWIAAVALSGRVIMLRRPVGVSVAWVAVIAALPMVGGIAYLLFGEVRFGRQRAARTATNLPLVQAAQANLLARLPKDLPPLEERAAALEKHAQRVLGLPALSDNQLVLLQGAHRFFEALVKDIDAARESCHACFYIWDARGDAAKVTSALIRAAGRGVECKVLADGVGSQHFFVSPAASAMRAAGVTIVEAQPTSLIRMFFKRGDLRNHRKLVVIDDRLAYVGSQNLVDPSQMHEVHNRGAAVDAMLRIEGPVAPALNQVFALDWAVETGLDCQAGLSSAAVFPRSGGARVQVIPSGPDLAPEAIHQLLLTAIYLAKRELIIATPYFVPDDSVLTALRSAALRGVVVTLIVPERNNSWLVQYASAACFDGLVEAGVSVLQFTRGLLHTKCMTVDGVTSMFGSVNFDMRSLWLNSEISLFIYDREATAELRAMQLSYMSACKHIDPKVWSQRSMRQRWTENVLRLIGPLL